MCASLCFSFAKKGACLGAKYGIKQSNLHALIHANPVNFVVLWVHVTRIRWWRFKNLCLSSLLITHNFLRFSTTLLLDVSGSLNWEGDVCFCPPNLLSIFFCPLRRKSGHPCLSETPSLKTGTSPPCCLHLDNRLCMSYQFWVILDYVHFCGIIHFCLFSAYIQCWLCYNILRNLR